MAMTPDPALVQAAQRLARKISDRFGLPYDEDSWLKETIAAFGAAQLALPDEATVERVALACFMAFGHDVKNQLPWEQAPGYMKDDFRRMARAALRAARGEGR